MSLAQLEYFVAVAETGAVSRAAVRLAISQPPLTRQIRMLEDELGTPLFERTRKGMTLLPAGRQFMIHAQRVLSEIELARMSLRCVANPESEDPTFAAPELRQPRGETEPS